jgi:hypothetical protein
MIKGTGWWLSHSYVDLGLVVATVGAHLTATRVYQAPVLLSGVPFDHRPALYGASAVVVSFTGTLASVSVAQYLQGRGDRVRALKRRHPDELGRTWKGIFFGCVTAAVLFLAAYAVDSRFTATAPPQTGETVGCWLFEVGVLLALLRLLRLTVLFGELIDLIVMDDTNPLLDANAYELTPEFFEGGNVTETEEPRPANH